jgi:hypothetical protein
VTRRQAFVFTSSLASALYMLLFKFLAHQYDFAFRFVSSCVSDTDLTAEEAQVRHWRTRLAKCLACTEDSHGRWGLRHRYSISLAR